MEGGDSKISNIEPNSEIKKLQIDPNVYEELLTDKDEEIIQLSQKLKYKENELKDINLKYEEIKNNYLTLEKSIKIFEEDSKKLSEELEHRIESEAELSKKISYFEVLKEENDISIKQMINLQEEIIHIQEQLSIQERLNHDLKIRWERLKKIYPNYLDFEKVEVENDNGIKKNEGHTWKVSDLFQDGEKVSEYIFKTEMIDGQIGLRIYIGSQAKIFSPKLIKENKEYLDDFRGITATEFARIKSSISILEIVEKSGWKNVSLPLGFDPFFWSPFIRDLISGFKSLPMVVRYDEIRLKRELKNVDYEHLWLVLHNLNVGSECWDKFEIRVSAANIQKNGFSRYPKFEIPLIDGKNKPFASWFPESADEWGQKFELRFSLDNDSLDLSVLKKMTTHDRLLILKILYAIPQMLQRLEVEKVAISRPWILWKDFVIDSLKIIQRMIVQPKNLIESTGDVSNENQADIEIKETTVKSEPKDLGVKRTRGNKKLIISKKGLKKV
jgi:hypothetical protein